jgi:hypothetical protein
MRRAVLAVLAVVASVVGLPATAAAAPPRSAPRDVSRPHTFIDDVSIAFVPSGAGLIGWRMQDGAGAGARGGESVAARSAAGNLGAPHPAPRGLTGDIVLFGTTLAAVALVRPVGSNRDPRSELRVAFGSTTSGAFGPSRRVVRHPRIAPPWFAGNARGDLALGWFEDRGTADDRVEVALRRAGHAFDAPLRLATGRVRSVSVAVGPRGDVLVAWDARGRSARGCGGPGTTASGAPGRCAPHPRSSRRCARPSPARAARTSRGARNASPRAATAAR